MPDAHTDALIEALLAVVDAAREALTDDLVDVGPLRKAMDALDAVDRRKGGQ